MTAVVATASCSRCPWTAGPGGWPEVDKAAEKHMRTARHPTATSARPAIKTSAAEVAAAEQEGITT